MVYLLSYYLISRAILSWHTYRYADDRDRNLVLVIGLVPFTGEDIMWQTLMTWWDNQ